MKTPIFIVLTIFLFCSAAMSQDTIRWKTGDANSDVMFVNGMEAKLLTLNGLKISATLIERKNWIPHTFISVENTGNARLLVDPTDWTLNIQGDKVKVLKSKEPDKLANSLDRRGSIASALTSLGGAMATKETTATVQNSNGTTSTVTVTEKDEAAQARASATGRQQQVTLADAAAYVRTSSLRTNTVMPGSVVFGIVWFEDKGFKEVVLMVKIGSVTCEFPFTKKK